MDKMRYLTNTSMTVVITLLLSVATHVSEGLSRTVAMSMETGTPLSVLADADVWPLLL